MVVSEDQNTVTLEDGSVHVFSKEGGCKTCSLQYKGLGDCDQLCCSTLRDDGRRGNFTKVSEPPQPRHIELHVKGARSVTLEGDTVYIRLD